MALVDAGSMELFLDCSTRHCKKLNTTRRCNRSVLRGHVPFVQGMRCLSPIECARCTSLQGALASSLGLIGAHV